MSLKVYDAEMFENNISLDYVYPYLNHIINFLLKFTSILVYLQNFTTYGQSIYLQTDKSSEQFIYFFNLKFYLNLEIFIIRGLNSETSRLSYRQSPKLTKRFIKLF